MMAKMKHTETTMGQEFQITPQPGDALILIDVQHDFLPGGALAVPDGDQILPAVGALADLFDQVILTQDWHPAGHSSFASSHPGRAPFEQVEMPYGDQVLWPDHCVQGTRGGELALPAWVVSKARLILRKGTRPGIDSYSAFRENDRMTRTGLAGYLRGLGVRRVILAGLATAYCVGFSALDAREAGFDVVVIESACRGIGPESIAERKAEMGRAGVLLA
jgi:nicotinamidase/pyrazinamidase